MTIFALSPRLRPLFYFLCPLDYVPYFPILYVPYFIYGYVPYYSVRIPSGP